MSLLTLNLFIISYKFIIYWQKQKHFQASILCAVPACSWSSLFKCKQYREALFHYSVIPDVYAKISVSLRVYYRILYLVQGIGYAWINIKLFEKKKKADKLFLVLCMMSRISGRYENTYILNIIVPVRYMHSIKNSVYS